MSAWAFSVWASACCFLTCISAICFCISGGGAAWADGGAMNWSGLEKPRAWMHARSIAIGSYIVGLEACSCFSAASFIIRCAALAVFGSAWGDSSLSSSAFRNTFSSHVYAGVLLRCQKLFGFSLKQRASNRNSSACDACMRLWTLFSTFAACSIIARVVPTGASARPSPTCCSDVPPIRIPVVAMSPTSAIRACDGSLYGRGMMA